MCNTCVNFQLVLAKGNQGQTCPIQHWLEDKSNMQQLQTFRYLRNNSTLDQMFYKLTQITLVAVA